MSQLQQRGMGLLTGRQSTSNLGNDSLGNQQPAQPSPGTTILDTLKKKMNQLKEELEVSKDESERTRQHFDEEEED